MAMPQYTPQQRAFLVREYDRNNRNVARVLERFREQYPHVRCPSRVTVYKNVRKYTVNGTSCNLNKGRSGRRRTERCPENIQAVREALENQEDGAPRISARRNGLGLTSATFNRITRLDLRFHPYQMIKRHQLLDNDYQRRINFCQWLRRQNRRFLENVVIGDEAGFALNATVNTHNVREYHPRGEKPLDFDYQRSNDRHKLTVWVGLMGNGSIIGPFFFRQNLDGEGYLEMLNEQVIPALRRMRRFGPNRNGRFRRLWWIQDGAPPHRRIIVSERLQQLFGERIVALNHAVEWPPRSPDLTPLDFFLWGYLKSKVYVTPPANLDDLEMRIRNEMDILRQDRTMVRRAVNSMTARAGLCVQRNGGHVED